MGFWSSLKRAVKRAVKAVARVVTEIVCRVLRIGTIILTYLGILPILTLKLRVLILRDDTGSPLAKPEEVLPVVERARDILRGSARIKVVPTSGDFVWTVNEFGPDVPGHALDLRGEGVGAVQDHLGLAGEFFDRMIEEYHSKATFPWNIPTTPVTCFIVRHIDGLDGIAFPIVGNCFAVDVDGLVPDPGIDAGSWIYPSIMAHELGHCMGLIMHRNNPQNLMFAGNDRGLNLSQRQLVIARSARCVSIY